MRNNPNLLIEQLLSQYGLPVNNSSYNTLAGALGNSGGAPNMAPNSNNPNLRQQLIAQYMQNQMRPQPAQNPNAAQIPQNAAMNTMNGTLGANIPQTMGASLPSNNPQMYMQRMQQFSPQAQMPQFNPGYLQMFQQRYGMGS